MDESKKWLKQAEIDLKAAVDNIETENYQWAAFLSQQVAEKSLKAIYIQKHQRLWKIHDLVSLGEKIQAPEDILKACEVLNPHYLASRYPMGADAVYQKEDAQEALNMAKKVIEWVQDRI